MNTHVGQKPRSTGGAHWTASDLGACACQHNGGPFVELIARGSSEGSNQVHLPAPLDPCHVKRLKLDKAGTPRQRNVQICARCNAIASNQHRDPGNLGSLTLTYFTKQGS